MLDSAVFEISQGSQIPLTTGGSPTFNVIKLPAPMIHKKVTKIYSLGNHIVCMRFTIKTLLGSQFVQTYLHGTCADKIAGVELHAKVWSRQREERVEFVAVLEEL